MLKESGNCMQLMILVDDAGGAYARIDHSPWNGCTLADFVMPFFLFIVGVAIALALKVPPSSSLLEYDSTNFTSLLKLDELLLFCREFLRSLLQ